MIEIRYATAADIDAFFGARPRQTMTARVLQMDGKVVSVAGLVREDTYVRLFWDITPGYEDVIRSLRVLREIKAMMDRVAQSQMPVVACAGNHELLVRLGFEQIEGDDYLWVGKRRSHTSQLLSAACSADSPVSNQPKERQNSSGTAPG